MQQRHRTETPADAPEPQAWTGRIADELGRSAHQVWMAGIGALARAQAKGSRLFEQLAEEGRDVAESRAEGDGGAAARLESLRRSLDAAMERTRERAGNAWDGVGLAFERRIRRSLRRMEVPTRHDLDLLGARIDALALELRRQRDGVAQAGTAEPPPSSQS